MYKDQLKNLYVEIEALRVKLSIFRDRTPSCIFTDVDDISSAKVAATRRAKCIKGQLNGKYDKCSHPKMTGQNER